MSIHLETKDLINVQQMEVSVNGPDGATHLILCTGMANLGSCRHETFTFFVGPQLSRRQFVGAVTSGALSMIQGHDNSLIEDNTKLQLEARLISIDASYDDEFSHIKVRVDVSSGKALKLAISFNVSILAELPTQ